MNSSSSSTSASSSSSISISTSENGTPKRQKTTNSSLSPSDSTTTQQIAIRTLSNSDFLSPPILEEAPFHIHQYRIDKASIVLFCEALIAHDENSIRTFMSKHLNDIPYFLDAEVAFSISSDDKRKTTLFDIIIFYGTENLLIEVLNECTPGRVFALMRKPHFLKNDILTSYGSNYIHRIFRTTIDQAFQKCIVLLRQIGPQKAITLFNERSQTVGTPTPMQELNSINEQIERVTPLLASKRKQETRTLLLQLVQIISLPSLLDVEGTAKALEDCTQNLAEAECQEFWSKLLRDYPTDPQSATNLTHVELITPNGKLNIVLVDFLLKNQPGMLFSWLRVPSPGVLLIPQSEVKKIIPRVLLLAQTFIPVLCAMLHKFKINGIPLIETIFENTSGDAHIQRLRLLSTLVPITSFATFIKTQKYKDGTLLSKTVEGLFEATPLLQSFVRALPQNPEQIININLQKIFQQEPFKLALLVWSQNFGLVAAIMQAKSPDAAQEVEFTSLAQDANTTPKPQLFGVPNTRKQFFEISYNRIDDVLDFYRKSYALADAIIYSNNYELYGLFKDRKIFKYLLDSLGSFEEDVVTVLEHEAVDPNFVVEAVSTRKFSHKALERLLLQPKTKYRGTLLEYLLSKKDMSAFKHILTLITDVQFGKMLTHQLPNGRFPMQIFLMTSEPPQLSATAYYSHTAFLTNLLKLAPKAFFAAMQVNYPILQMGRCEFKQGFTLVIQGLPLDADNPASKGHKESLEFLNQLKAKDHELFLRPMIPSFLVTQELFGRGPQHDESRGLCYDLIAKNNVTIMNWFLTNLTNDGLFTFLGNLDQNGGNALSYAIEACNLEISGNILARYRECNDLPHVNFPESLQELLELHTLTVNQIVDKIIVKLRLDPVKGGFEVVPMLCALHIHMSPEKVLNFKQFIAEEDGLNTNSFDLHSLDISFASPIKVLFDKVEAGHDQGLLEPFYEELFTHAPHLFVKMDTSRLTAVDSVLPILRPQSYREAIRGIDQRGRAVSYSMLFNLQDTNYAHVYRSALASTYQLTFQGVLAPSNPNVKVLTNESDAVRQFQFYYNFKTLMGGLDAASPSNKEQVAKELQEMSLGCDPRSRATEDITPKYFKGSKLKPLYMALLMMQEGILVPRETAISTLPGTFFARICDKMRATRSVTVVNRP